MQSINRTNPVGPATNATSVTFTVTFSEPVTGVDPSDFQLATTGTVGTTAYPGDAARRFCCLHGDGQRHHRQRHARPEPGGQRQHPRSGRQPPHPAERRRRPSRTRPPSPPGPAQGLWRWRTSTATASPTWSSPHFGSSTVSVLLGNGNGTFQAQQTFATGLSLACRGGGGRQRRRQARPGSSAMTCQ